MLLLRANRVVSRDRLVDAVWGERAPETANSALQGYVSMLRKTLSADRILTRAPGYVLPRVARNPDRIDRIRDHGAAQLQIILGDCIGNFLT